MEQVSILSLKLANAKLYLSLLGGRVKAFVQGLAVTIRSTLCRWIQDIKVVKDNGVNKVYTVYPRWQRATDVGPW